jgi:catechol 2,3-dioxygenase-like lactoylglutathione lyase family enzyme
VAFVATSQPERARAFYADVLGLRLTSDEPYALVFQAGDTMLRIQKTDAVQPPPYTTLGWQVQDITATARELMGRGVSFERFGSMEQDDLGIWSAPGGARVAWFKDPDGNLLSLTQLGA